MPKVAEFRRWAQACRELAAQMSKNYERRSLLDMARQWERVADERERALKEHWSPKGG